MENQSIYLKPITLRNIMKFALPTIAMSLFMSFYTMVDGLFVSNLIGTSALSAINLSAPVISFVTAISTMLATGGSAVIMKKIGEKKQQEANENFTFLIIVNIVIGFIMCFAGYVCMNFVFSHMNVSAEVLHYSQEYLGYYLFIKIIGMGIKGAAIATGLGYSVTMIVGFFIFWSKKNLLHFTKPRFCFGVLKKAVSNGCSEMATSLVTGITTLFFNWTMLKYVGENGVAAITIIMYVLMFVSSLFSGYSYGVAPMISYYYGEQNHKKLKTLIRKSLKIIAAISVISLMVSLIITKPLVSIFARPDNPVFELAVTGNRICSIALLFIGFNIFSSGMFTALNNGIVSAILAFSRSFVFMVICLLVLPLLLEVTGIWLATPAAELLAILLACVMFMKYKNQYKY